MAVAITAHINANAGIAALGKIGVGQAVTRRCSIALAVGQKFQNGRDRRSFSIGRHPDPCRQAASISHDNRHIRDFGNISQIGNAHVGGP